MEEDYDEDEMLRVAEELSLLAKKEEVLWTENDTETTESSVQLLDQIIEVQMNNNNTMDDPDEESAMSCSMGLITIEKLRYYQEKIVRTIQSIPEDTTLAILLELNDSVSTVLSKAIMVPKLRQGGIVPPTDPSSDSSRSMNSTYDGINSNSNSSSSITQSYNNLSLETVPSRPTIISTLLLGTTTTTYTITIYLYSHNYNIYNLPIIHHVSLPLHASYS